MAKYKQKCYACKTAFVIVTRHNPYAKCYDCEKNELSGEIEDKEMKKFFDIPEDFYKTNAFLRDIKVNYLRYGKLSERQIEAFKKVVADMQKNS